MAKYNPTPISSTLSISAAAAINENLNRISTALENTVSRDGTTPNQMGADLDLNSNDLLNVKQIDAERLVLDGVPVQTLGIADALKISNALSELAPLGLDDDARANIGAASSAQGALADTSVQRVRSVASLAASTITSAIKVVVTEFHTPTYTTPSTLHGGAKYRRASFTELASIPTQAYVRSIDRFMPDGSTDNTNGGYWLLDEVVIDWRMMGVKADGSTDDTVAAQAAIDFCLLDTKRTLKMTGVVSVSKLVFQNASNALVKADNCFVVANSVAAQTALIEIKMSNFVTEGRLLPIVGYKTNYECAVWYWHETAAQFSILRNIVPNSAKIGFRVGNIAFPGALISELTIENPQTYACPVAMEIIGGETYVDVTGPQMWASGVGGDVAWLALDVITLRNLGASVNVSGGEMIIPDSTDGVVHEMQPINRGGGRVEWGSTIFDTVFCETASPLSRTANPGALVINNTASNRRGLIQFSNCSGFHSQDLAAFIYLDPTYDDFLVVENPGFWKSGALRTAPNIFCEVGSTAEVTSIGDFGPSFQKGLAGITRGRLNFTRRQVLRAVGLNGVSFTAASGAQTCLYTSLDSANDKARFQGNYSAGVFTIPDGGLNDVEVFVNFRLTGTSTGNIFITENGTEVARAPIVAGVAQIQYHFGDKAAGVAIAVQADVDTNDTGQGANYLNVFSIYARRGYV